jgi:hypothetical protein
MAKEFSADKFKVILDESGKNVNWLAFRLSQKLGTQVDTIRPRRWLNGETKPDGAMILLIAKIFNRPMADFYEDTENTSSSKGVT